MKEFLNSRVSKYFFYMLLGGFVFLALTLLGMFIAGNTNVFKWDETGRVMIVMVGSAITFGVICYRETN